LLVALQGLEAGDSETLIDFLESSMSDLDGDWAEYPDEVVIDEIAPATTEPGF
jgi:hypothetical protein